MDDLVQELFKLLEEERAEVRRLTDILLRRDGLLPENSSNSEGNTPSKVRISRIPWNTAKERLEFYSKEAELVDLGTADASENS